MVASKSGSMLRKAGQLPLVSVIVNCYNGEKYLRDAIDSILAQTYQNLEIIFWDNQSTDQSAEICKSYDNPRLNYFYAPKHTLLYEARNFAIEKASGEFLAFLDVDDWWLPVKLEQQMPLFNDSQVGMVCGNYWVVSERKCRQWKYLKHHLPTGWVLNDLLKSYFVGLLTLVVRRSALDSLGNPCNPCYHIIGDFDLLIRLSIHWKLDCVQEPLAFYRYHDANESHNLKRLVTELETWYLEMGEHPLVSKQVGFHMYQEVVGYMKGLSAVEERNWSEALSCLWALPFGPKMIRLFTAMVLPTKIRNMFRP